MRRPPRAAALPLILCALIGCGLSGCGLFSSSNGSPDAPRTPPAGASQPPGAPLATASPAPTTALSGPQGVAASCYVRWQSYDSRTDQPTSALMRTRSCFTPGYYQVLSDAAGDQTGAGWLALRQAQTRAQARLIGTPDVLSGSAAVGRIVLLLHVRISSQSTAGSSDLGIGTPVLTMVRSGNGPWQIDGVDRTGSYGDAPGA